jgi:hypothetical protein
MSAASSWSGMNCGTRMVDLGDVGAGEQHPGWDVVPFPGSGFGDEPGYQRDDGTPERDRRPRMDDLGSFGTPGEVV